MKPVIRIYQMWAIKVRGKHKPFMAFEKSHHAKQKCKDLSKLGIVCKITPVEVKERLT